LYQVPITLTRDCLFDAIFCFRRAGSLGILLEAGFNFLCIRCSLSLFSFSLIDEFVKVFAGCFPSSIPIGGNSTVSGFLTSGFSIPISDLEK
uniref:Secreted protein n=1 Tax=Rodentolepis nana TaxID=102285 RepID=A0A158QIJ5_RODNA